MALQGDDAKKFIQAQLAQGQKVQSADPTGQKDYGFLGNLVMQPLQQANRLGAAFGDFTTGFYKDKNNAPALQGDTKYLSDYDAEQYKNPLNIAKDAVGLASNFVPFGLAGKGIGAAIKGGAAIGAAQGFGNTYGQNTIEDTVGGTLTGMAGGAAGGLAMPLIGKVAGKLGQKFAPKVEGAGANVVDDLSTGLGKAFKKAESSFDRGAGNRFDNFKQRLKGAELDVSAGADINNPLLLKRQTQNVLDTLGEPQSINGIVRGKQKVGDLMDSYVDDVFKADPKQRIKGDDLFGQNFQDEIQSIAIGTNTDPAQINAFAKGLIGQGKYGEFTDIVSKNYTVGDLKQILQDVNASLRNKDITGVRRLYAEEVKKALYDKMATIAPKYKDISRAYRVLATNEKSTALKALKGDPSASQAGVLGLQGILPISETKNMLVRGAGNVLDAKIPLPKSQGVSQNLEKLSNFLTKDGMPKTRVAQIVGAQAMLEMFDADGNGELDDQEQAMADQSGMNPQVMGDMNTGSDMGGDSMESIYSDAFAIAMQQTKGDAVAARKQAAAITSYDPFDKKDSESKTPAKMQQQIKEMSGAEVQLNNLLKEADKYQSNVPLIGGLLGKNPWDAKRKGYLTKLKAAMQDAATGMEGKSLTDADREFYNSFLPNENDTPEAFKESINAILETIATKKAALQQ